MSSLTLLATLSPITVHSEEYTVKKVDVLSDQDPDLVANECAAVVGVKGDVIKIGDMLVPTTEGNWGKEE